MNSSFTPHQVGILHLLWNQYSPLTSMWFKQPFRLNAAMLMLNKQHCVKLAYLWMFIPLLLPQTSTPHGQESCLFNSVCLEPYIHIRYVMTRIFFFTIPHSLWDLSSLTRDWNCVPCSGSREHGGLPRKSKILVEWTDEFLWWCFESYQKSWDFTSFSSVI